MPKVKLTVCRVRYVPEDPRVFVDDKVGDVVEVTAKEGWAMVDANQATWVGESPERPEGTEPELDPESASDLFSLALDNKVIGVLMAEDASGAVPAFDNVAALRAFVDQGGDLVEKKGIGKSTAVKILQAIVDSVPPAANEVAAPVVEGAGTSEDDNEPVLEA